MWCMASAVSSPSSLIQPYNITILWPVTSYSALEQTHVCSTCRESLLEVKRLDVKPVTSWSEVQHPNHKGQQQLFLSRITLSLESASQRTSPAYWSWRLITFIWSHTCQLVISFITTVATVAILYTVCSKKKWCQNRNHNNCNKSYQN